MKKIVLLLVLFVAVQAMGAAVFPKGDTVQSLKNSFTFKNGLVDAYGSLDPSSAGFTAPVGSTYESSNGSSYKKTGAGDTAWSDYEAEIDANTTHSGSDGSDHSKVTANETAISNITTLNDSNIIVGNGSNVATDVAMSGEATIVNTGAVTLDNASVIGKQLTGFSHKVGAVLATDSILTGIEKNHGSIDSGMGTRLMKGGVISKGAGAATVNVTAGEGVIVDNFTDIDNPVITHLSWGALTDQPVTTVAGGNLSTIAINAAGALVFSNSLFTASEQRDYLILGGAIHTDGVNVVGVDNAKRGSHISVGRDLADLADVIGPINQTGNVYFANAGANLEMDKTSGTYFSLGANYGTSKKTPNTLSASSCTTCTFMYVNRDGSGGFDVAGAAAIAPSSYDDGDGTLGTVGPNKYTIQRVYIAGKTTAVQYGQTVYNSETDALNAVSTETFIESPLLSQGLFRAFLIVKSNETDLSNSTFLEAAGALGSGGSGTPSTNSWVLNNIDHTTNPNNVGVDCNTIFLADASGGAVTITLPDSAAGNNECVNKFVLGANTNPVTVTTAGGTQLIGTKTSQIIDTLERGFEVVSDASVPKYRIIQDSRSRETVAINYLSGDDVFADDSIGSWVGETGLTLTHTTTTPLRGNGSFLISKAAGDQSTKRVSVDFTVDAIDKNKVIGIQFDYEDSANYATNDLTLVVNDGTDDLTVNYGHGINSGLTKFTGYFEGSGQTSYTLKFIPSNSALAYTVKVDNVRISSEVVPNGIESYEVPVGEVSAIIHHSGSTIDSSWDTMSTTGSTVYQNKGNAFDNTTQTFTVPKDCTVEVHAGSRFLDIGSGLPSSNEVRVLKDPFDGGANEALCQARSANTKAVTTSCELVALKGDTFQVQWNNANVPIGTVAADHSNWTSFRCNDGGSNTVIAPNGMVATDVEIPTQAKQYDLTVTGTNYTTVRAVGTPYQTTDGAWRMAFNIYGTTAITTASLTMSISGVTFKNTSNYRQAVSLATGSANGSEYAYTTPNTGDITAFAEGVVSVYSVSGDVELDSKPTWASDYQPTQTVSALVAEYSDIKSSNEKVIGEWFGQPLYERSFVVTGTASATVVIDAAFTPTLYTPVNDWAYSSGDSITVWYKSIFTLNATSLQSYVSVSSSGLRLSNLTDTTDANVTIKYTKVSENP